MLRGGWHVLRMQRGALMSAGRLPWEPVGFAFTDPASGVKGLVGPLSVEGCDPWFWQVSLAHRIIAKGTAKTSSKAKGEARKAFEAFVAQRVTP